MLWVRMVEGKTGFFLCRREKVEFSLDNGLFCFTCLISSQLLVATKTALVTNSMRLSFAHPLYGVLHGSMASLVVQRLKCLPAMWETWVRSLGREDPLEKEMATHSSILAWRIPWTEELGGYSPRVTNSRTQLNDFTFIFHLS